MDSNSPKRTIHIRIRDLRRERSLTQEELAEALGLSRQSINAMEAGRCLPSLPVAIQIASYFSVPVQNVFGMDAEQVQEAVSAISNQGTALSMVSPWSPLREMRDALDGLVEEMNTSTLPQQMIPVVNLYQYNTTVVLEFCLPGYRKEDISIDVGEDFVMVSGELSEELEPDGRQYFRREFMRQGFTRTVSLPGLIHIEGVGAEMKAGILTITLPKLIEEKPKTSRVTIKSVE
jgi:HSP20 family protein